MPEVWVRRSRMVISRFAGTVRGAEAGVAPGAGSSTTMVFAKAGRYFDTGSASRRRPSSTSIIAATLVTALENEAMRTMVSRRIGTLASTSDWPSASKWTTFPPRAMRVTDPAIRRSSIRRWSAPVRRRSRSEERPALSGVPCGRPWARAGNVTTRSNRPSTMRLVMEPP
jgi:hypothetical protein